MKRKMVKSDAKNGRSNNKKRFPGVSKRGNKWQARIRNPKLGSDVYLGHYRTPEEASVVVENKRAEFKAMYKGEEGSCSGYFMGKKLPVGIRRQNGWYLVRVWDRMLNKCVSGGFYETLKDAVNALARKKAEIRRMYGWNPRVEPETVVQSTFDCSDQHNDDNVEIPRGVRRINRTGKWVARIKKPDSKDRIWLGTYNTVEEAISCFKKKKAEFDAKLKRRELEATETPMKFEYDCPTSLSDARDLSNFAIGDKLSYDDSAVVDVDGPVKLEDGSPTSIFSLEDENNVSTVSGKTFDSEFERAVSLGIIDEYGQLLGQHSELDKFMALSMPEENVADYNDLFF